MYQGWMSFGCNEILSRSRAYGYATTADCPIYSLRLPDCEANGGPLDPGQYPYALIDEAPWYDAQDETTSRFFGAYPISIGGLSDGTGEATLTEGILSGGYISGYREAARQISVTAALIAQGGDALETGMSWLKAALRPDECGMHGTSCGEVDIQFYADCPPAQIPGETEEEYDRRLGALTRDAHSVSLLSAPKVVQEIHRNGLDAFIVRFVLGAGSPFIFAQRRAIEVPPTTPVVIQDSPVNLVPYPSAELGSGSIVVATNYATNPSLETNATGWAAAMDAPATANGGLTSGRVTGELAAVGNASYRAVYQAVSAPGGATQGSFWSEFDCDLSTRPAASRVSINIWAAELLMAGTAVSRPAILVSALWYDGAVGAGSLLRTDALGSIPVAGGALSTKSIEPPSGATHVKVRVTARMTGWSNTLVLRLYADALAVTVP